MFSNETIGQEKRFPSYLFVALIICLSVGGLISTDIFLPALNQMSEFYNSSEEGIQGAIAIFLLGISVSQLLYGPLTDSLGRKLVLIAGVLLWLLATLGIFLSTTIGELMILRLLQGIGACAGITISRAIISDTLDRERASALYLTIFPFVGMSPAVAPMIGGLLSRWFGWKSCFVFLGLFILTTLLLCSLVLEETLPKARRQELRPAVLVRNIKRVLVNRQFLFYSAVPCFAYATYFAYIVESPFMLTQLGLGEGLIGYTYGALSITYVLGNLTARKVSQAIGSIDAIKKGYLIFAIGGTGFATQAFLSPYPIVTSILTMSVLTFGNGFLLPLGTASAIASQPKLAGTASGIMGSLQLGSAAISSAIIGNISHHQPIAIAALIGASSLLGCAIYWIGHSRSLATKQS